MQVKLAQWSILVLVGINFSGEKFFGAQVSVEPRFRGVKGGGFVQGAARKSKYFIRDIVTLKTTI